MNSSHSNDTAIKHDNLLSEIQSDFPLVSKPFQALAERIGSTEREVIDSIRSLEENNVIRVFGPVFDARKLGYVSTLVTAVVENERVAELAAEMLDINEITHNYLRNNERNLWFTITAQNTDIIDDIIKRIENFPGVNEVLNLPAKKTFKINAVWGKKDSSKKHVPKETEVPPQEAEKNIIRALQKKFPLTEQPFITIAESVGIEEQILIDTIVKWLQNGIIRRFGARLSHKRIGYTVNTLALWKGDDVDRWGDKFAELPAVSHCYLRESHERWPYELYTMVHAKSSEESDTILHAMREIASGSEMLALQTLFELKKISMKYFMEK